MDPFKEDILKENFAVIKENEDEVLEPLLEEIDGIIDADMRSFVRAILISAPEWYWTAASALDEDAVLEDEAVEGGLVVSIRRAIKTFEILGLTANLSESETDVGKAAILLAQLDKYKTVEDELEYNLWYAFSTCQKIDRIMSFNKLWGKDGLSNTIAIGIEKVDEIKRLIRIQDGKWTVIPEVRPRNALELCFHQSLYLASALKWLVELDIKL